jgi:flap endonuclease-1
LLGCDYVDPIKGVGPKVAYTMIKEHKSLEAVVKILQDSKKYTIPDDWPWEEAKLLFQQPDVRPADHAECNFEWKAPDVPGLLKFLVEEKGFSDDRVKNGSARLTKGLKTAQQSRLEGFFKPIAKTPEEQASLKRKNEAKLEDKKKKQKQAAKEKKDAKAKPRGTA